MLFLEPLFNTDTQAETDFFTYRSFFHDEETQRLFYHENTFFMVMLMTTGFVVPAYGTGLVLNAPVSSSSASHDTSKLDVAMRKNGSVSKCLRERSMFVTPIGGFRSDRR